MRWLFLLLLVLNIFYYVWHQQEAPLRAKDVTPLALYRGGQQDIRLLSESANAMVRRDRATQSEGRSECLYLGGLGSESSVWAVEQRLTSLDVKVTRSSMDRADDGGYWLQVAPESRRLVGEELLQNLANEFNELKHKIMPCEGIATVE